LTGDECLFSLTDIWQARRRLQPHILRTPLLLSHSLSQLTGCQIYLKMECWQLCGCFKVRGAINMVASLSNRERRSGLVTCSSGNHGVALSFAARLFGQTPTKVFVPENAERTKTKKISLFGAEVVYYGNDFLNTLEYATNYAKEHAAVFVHSHSHPLVIAGQGTIGLEIIEDLPDVEVVIVPVGGGGLIAGIVTALKSARKRIQVIGVEPSAAPGAYISFRDGYCHEKIPLRTSIADGLMGTLTPLTFALTYRLVDEIALVEDQEIIEAMRVFWEEEQLMIEGSAAVGLAAVLAGKLNIKKQKTVLVLTGRNINWDRYRLLLEHGHAS